MEPVPHVDDILPQGEAARIVGPYRLGRVLGVGATGTVYLADRIDFPQRVAIKLFHSTFLTAGIASPAGEERVLLLLDHPHIVRSMQRAAEADGTRYLVLEYIDGTPIDQFADEHQLSIPNRIRLLLQALHAVEHAHRHLIIHRDLKPAHLLVTEEGEVKLLDFGIAGSVGPSAFTRDFASPEQTSLAPGTPPVSVGSDIYSLGLIARLVLAGVPPATRPEIAPSQHLHRSTDEAADRVAQARGLTRRKLERALAGDLDAILLQALRPDPQERYASAANLAEDLEAYLEGRTVRALPVSRLEHARRWVLRNRILATAAMILIVAIVFSSAGVLWQSGRALRERHRTEARLRDLVRMTGTLDGELYTSLGTLPDADPARSMLLTNATRTLDSLSPSAQTDPVLRLELATQYGRLASLLLVHGPAAIPTGNTEAERDIASGLQLLAPIPRSGSIGASAQVQRERLLALQKSLAR